MLLAAQTATEGTGGLGGLVQFAPIILMFVVFYFVLIRPQRKRKKKTGNAGFNYSRR